MLDFLSNKTDWIFCSIQNKSVKPVAGISFSSRINKIEVGSKLDLKSWLFIYDFNWLKKYFKQSGKEKICFLFWVLILQIFHTL